MARRTGSSGRRAARTGAAPPGTVPPQRRPATSTPPSAQAFPTPRLPAHEAERLVRVPSSRGDGDRVPRSAGRNTAGQGDRGRFGSRRACGRTTVPRRRLRGRSHGAGRPPGCRGRRSPGRGRARPVPRCDERRGVGEQGVRDERAVTRAERVGGVGAAVRRRTRRRTPPPWAGRRGGWPESHRPPDVAPSRSPAAAPHTVRAAARSAAWSTPLRASARWPSGRTRRTVWAAALG